ncbi:MAG: GNAT family N-acetyltransferase [Ruminococcus sp.]|nr:GNAT family N-acetyltransferase [Ruminococcus sp.]
MIRKIVNSDYEVISQYYKEFDNNNTDLFNLGPFEHVYIYDDNNNIEGFINYSIIYDRAELNYIYVSKECRGRHIANNMMIFLINDVKKNGCSNITLEVDENNLVGISLYEKFGFKKVSIRNNYYKNSNAILMMKELNDNE